jgi:hypothetical protein
MKGLKLAALMSVITCAIPTAVMAQTTPVDIAYLDDLYGFLAHEDAITYNMATQSFTNEDHVGIAYTFCNAFATGMNPTDAFWTFMEPTINETPEYGGYLSDDEVYSVSLYGSIVMKLSSTHYCPEYQAQVDQALLAIANGESYGNSSYHTNSSGTGGKPWKKLE